MSQTAQDTPVPALPLPTRPTSEPTTPTFPTTPTTDSPPATPNLPHKPTEPLYTEIRIPLPSIPSKSSSPSSNPAAANNSSPKSRSRAHTLHSFSPFHKRRSSSSHSSPSGSRTASPRVSSEEGWRHEMAMMRFGRGRESRKRTGTIDALAVAPAVMILKAELFTPREVGDDTRK